jgi:hypothetical protein
MIAIAQNGVQPREVLTVTLDGRGAPRQISPNILAMDSLQGGASVTTLDAAVLAPVGDSIAHVDNSLLAS